MKRIILLLAILISPSTVIAKSYTTAGDLLQHCEIYTNQSMYDEANKSGDVGKLGRLAVSTVWCVETIATIVNMIYFYESMLEPKDKLICLPEGISNQQIIEMFIDVANVNPAIMRERATYVILKSLRRIYPCKK